MSERITISRMKRYVVLVLIVLVMSVSSCRKSPPPDNEKPDTGPGKVTDIKTSGTPEPVTSSVTESDVPIPIELPMPMFVGTPQNIQGVSRLAKPLGHNFTFPYFC